MIFYDVYIIDSSINSIAVYTADYFKVDSNRILRIYSKEFGNVHIQLNDNEKLYVCEIRCIYDENGDQHFLEDDSVEFCINF